MRHGNDDNLAAASLKTARIAEIPCARELWITTLVALLFIAWPGREAVPASPGEGIPMLMTLSMGTMGDETGAMPCPNDLGSPTHAPDVIRPRRMCRAAPEVHALSINTAIDGLGFRVLSQPAGRQLACPKGRERWQKIESSPWSTMS